MFFCKRSRQQDNKVRLKKQLQILDFKKLLRQNRSVAVVVFLHRHFLFQVTFTIAMQGRFVAVFTILEINSPVPLIMQYPGRPNGCLCKNAAYQQE